MYKAVIDSLVTGLFFDTGNDIRNEDSVGVLINTENIIELIESIPISEFYLKKEGQNQKISKTKALKVYNKIFEIQNESKKQNERRI